MNTSARPAWQQMTALVSLSASGAITGFSFVPKAPADIQGPSSLPIHLVALEKSASPAPADDSALRSAIVNVANHYLRMAGSRSPGEMEALIWQSVSTDGADHGPSCAAFASLTLELAAQVVGQQSWVTGGTSYPWPVHKWADVRVDPGPSPDGVVSLVQDAEAHQRWHPLGDGYQPMPGDWVLFDGHVEVVTGYTHGALHTVGGDSLPNFSVNAHVYRGPLGADGVAGFVNNGALAPGAATTATPAAASGAAPGARHHDHEAGHSQESRGSRDVGSADIPGIGAANQGNPHAHPPGRGTTGRSTGSRAVTPSAPDTGAPPAPAAPATGSQSRTPASTPGAASQATPSIPGPTNVAAPIVPPATSHATPPAAPASHDVPGRAALGGADVPGAPLRSSPEGHDPRPHASRRAHRQQAGDAASASGASIPGLPPGTRTSASQTARKPDTRKAPAPAAAGLSDATAKQEFIRQIAPGAIAAQQKYGVPASVTIAQAINESGWGQSTLATRDHNLFGIKGAGPAGSDSQPTQEYVNGTWVTRTTPFRVYQDTAQSIDDHGKLLATSQYYRQAMALRHDPNAFAGALTGVYATDPQYGAKLIGLMRRYNLYRYDTAAPAAKHDTPAQGDAAIPGVPSTATRRAAPISPPRRDQSASSTTKGQGTARRPRTEKAAPMAATEAASAERIAEPVRRPRISPVSTAHPRKAPRYQHQIPPPVTTAFSVTAREPLTTEEPLYTDVASHHGLRWELLAACDWMQCEARPRYSPVHGEKLGTVNPDGSVYRTRSEALEQCAEDLLALAGAVYGIDLATRRHLSIRELASAFAAFRWGGLLKLHRTSAMEFPYAVAGLTAQHLSMRWPNIDEPSAPDKPGGRFRRPFGAVPVVLLLGYPATV